MPITIIDDHGGGIAVPVGPLTPAGWIAGFGATGTTFGSVANQIAPPASAPVVASTVRPGTPGLRDGVPLSPWAWSLAKSTEAGTKGSTITIDLYAGPTVGNGTEEVYKAGVDCYLRFGDVDSGSWLIVFNRGPGWEVAQAECPE